MAVGVVEPLEVIHIHHRDGVGAAEPGERLVQRAASREAGQRVVISQHVGQLDRGYHEGAACCGEIQRAIDRRIPGLERKERRGERPNVSVPRAAGREASRSRHQSDAHDEGQHRKLRDRRPGEEPLREEGVSQGGGNRTRAAGPEHRVDQGGERADRHPLPDARRGEHATLGQQGDGGERERDQQGGELERDGIPRFPARDQEVRQAERHDREHQAAPPQAPGQDQPGESHRGGGESHELGPGRWEAVPPAEQDCRDEEQSFGGEERFEPGTHEG